MPLILSIALFFLGTGFFSSYFSNFLDQVLFGISGWWIYPLFSVLLKIGLYLSLSTLFAYGLFSIFSIIASPFHLYLAEALCLKNNYPVVTEIKNQIKLFFFLLKISIKKMLLFSALGILFFVLSFVPVVSIFANFAIVWIIALDSMDYIMELKAVGLVQRLKFSFTFFPFFLGLSFFLSLSVLVPGLLLIVFPFTVIGSTQYFIKQI